MAWLTRMWLLIRHLLGREPMRPPGYIVEAEAQLSDVDRRLRALNVEASAHRRK